MLLVLAICFAAFPWEYVDPMVLAAASHAGCDAEQVNHDHGDHSGPEDPCGDDCGCLCCPGHGQFPSSGLRLPGAPVLTLVALMAPSRDNRSGRASLNNIFRPPRTI